MILPSGALKIIDRKKNIFKLAQGEYVAPEKIENVYNQMPIIEEIFVHGDSLESSLLAFIVPEKSVMIDIGKELGIKKSFEQLCFDKNVNAHILKLMNARAKEAKLFGFEKARKIHILTKSFGEDGLLTTTFKLRR